MTDSPHNTDLKKTPFHAFHLEHGAKMVPFAGYDMPLHYGSLLEEHRAVRTAAGMFDVSHMGRVRFTGRHARRLLETVCTRKLSDMTPGQCRYSLVCNERGGALDDVIIYRFEDDWMMVCNASNRDKIVAHLHAVAARTDMSVRIDDQTDKTAMIALQGPRVMEMIAQFSKEVPTLKRYRFTVKNLVIVKLIISRTGYTGEDGVEVILPAAMISMALKLFLGKAGDAIRPCGLGARDTLRTEAGMPLYGHELDEETDPLSASLSFAVSLDKGAEPDGPGAPGFIGQDALQRVASEGPSKKLIGLKLDGKRSPRPGMPILLDGKTVGKVTSGCLSPTLGYPIAMGFVDPVSATRPSFSIDFGRESAAATSVPLPFYKPKSP